jgi:hypothetical protein
MRRKRTPEVSNLVIFGGHVNILVPHSAVDSPGQLYDQRALAGVNEARKTTPVARWRSMSQSESIVSSVWRIVTGEPILPVLRK